MDRYGHFSNYYIIQGEKNNFKLMYYLLAVRENNVYFTYCFLKSGSYVF